MADEQWAEEFANYYAKLKRHPFFILAGVAVISFSAGMSVTSVLKRADKLWEPPTPESASSAAPERVPDREPPPPSQAISKPVESSSEPSQDQIKGPLGMSFDEFISHLHRFDSEPRMQSAYLASVAGRTVDWVVRFDELPNSSRGPVGFGFSSSTTSTRSSFCDYASCLPGQEDVMYSLNKDDEIRVKGVLEPFGEGELAIEQARVEKTKPHKSAKQ